MSKPLRIAAIIIAVAVLLAGCAVAVSHIAWGRSLKASLYELDLRRRFATDRTVEDEIARLEAKREAGETPYSLPAGLKLTSDIEERDRDGLQVFTLNGSSAGPVVLYLHGGAYINAFNAYQWRFMDRLTQQTDCVTVAPAYHLAPYADHARAYDDLSALYRALLEEYPGRRLILMGDSAGGGLALGLAEYLLEQGDALPERLVLFSPWVDVSMDNPDIASYVPVEPMLHLELVTLHGRYWAGAADTHFWMVSPSFGEMAGLPPTTLYCGTRELLYPDIMLASDKLLAAGVDLDLRVGRGMNHDWPLMPLPEAEAAFADICGLVEGD